MLNSGVGMTTVGILEVKLGDKSKLIYGAHDGYPLKDFIIKYA